jgi:hypothetical protein
VQRGRVRKITNNDRSKTFFVTEMLPEMKARAWRNGPVLKVLRRLMFFSCAVMFSAYSVAANAQWNTKKDTGGANITTSSESGGMLGAICLLRSGRCQWAVVVPEADCKVGSRVPVSISGQYGTLVVSAECNSLPLIERMPGAGRMLWIDAPSRLIESAVSTQDTTFNVRTSNGKFVQHAFKSQGSEAALNEAGNWMRTLYNQEKTQ